MGVGGGRDEKYLVSTKNLFTLNIKPSTHKDQAAEKTPTPHTKTPAAEKTGKDCPHTDTSGQQLLGLPSNLRLRYYSQQTLEGSKLNLNSKNNVTIFSTTVLDPTT